VESLKTRDIAIETDKANEQHYEVDTDFMLSCMGKRAKYSCCLFESGKESLDEAEEAMLESYCVKAQLQDGQDVLDLGCGWGSLCLFLAEKYPNSRVKLHIDSVAKAKGFKNLEVSLSEASLPE
jgi:cyclopropane fatty-acyl-phospholipid synthase-like methyltransferase